MPLETFRGPNVSALLARAQRSIGHDAVVVSLRRLHGTRPEFELVAADPATARLATPPGRGPAARPPRVVSDRTPPARIAPSLAGGAGDRERPRVRPERPTLAPARPARTPRLPAGSPGRPAIIALVGPTGAGKTTTIAKLANHPDAFGDQRVGLVCLDTYRVGAIEQSRIYAELSGLPLEIVYHVADIGPALERLRRCSVLLVDTAGRGPRGQGDTASLRALLHALRPDETHLALPAGLKDALAQRVIEHHQTMGATHVLPTKIDEAPDDPAPFELARASGLGIRWITDGQDVPRDLHLADRAMRPARVGVA